MKQENKRKDRPGRRDPGTVKGAERRKRSFYPQKMANDPKLLQAFSQQFAICKQDITHIPAKYMELMLMLMGAAQVTLLPLKHMVNWL